ncbi:hypothetical protein BpHYR1_002878 [Brachionus plicatilis]|uniref:Uncharacterized protein n=1 Tax=Brachionus plicatilis TaxID=10195 RepID=A0A3M7P9J5_BRAPC|nr:hypothetical protein BpHYR1_002878 [Brachionus plicatilis]
MIIGHKYLDMYYVLAMMCRFHDLEWHPNAKDVPLGANRKKGRPGKNKRALVIFRRIRRNIKAYTSIPTDQEQEKMFSQLRVFFTSRRLLSATVHVTHVNLDGTYKFIWNGFPVKMIVTTDRCKPYHPFGLALTKSETVSDYEFICNSLKIAVSKINLPALLTTILIADGSYAITIGLSKLLVSLVNELCVGPMCLEMLIKQWFTKQPGWFEGNAPGYPSSNNALESTNRFIKGQSTFKDRLTVPRFISVVDERIIFCHPIEIQLTKIPKTLRPKSRQHLQIGQLMHNGYKVNIRSLNIK